jgi:hypothetical protein
MSLDDFNRAVFDRASGKYNRAQFEQMTTDEWVALVEGHRAQAEEARNGLTELREMIPDRDN